MNRGQAAAEARSGARGSARDEVDAPAGAVRVEAVLLDAGAEAGPLASARAPRLEWVAQEVPISFELDGSPHVVMLATPADLEDFALGFLLTEGLIDRAADLLGCEIRLREKGVVLALRLAPECSAKREARRRNLTGRTGCGLCGTEDLDHVLRLPPTPLPPTRVEAAALARAMGELGARQTLGGRTGATHAAAFCDASGAIRLVREDVGRHNALDKLVGALVRTGHDPSAGFVAVTSRASVEMVQKTALAGVPILAAVSAPTQLAVQVAREAGLVLAGFVRGARATVYAGAERVEVRS